MTDTPTFVSTLVSKYQDVDVVLSLSQCAGIDPKYRPGTFLVPNKFIPFEKKTISVATQYTVQNDLNDQPVSILSFSRIVDYVNSSLNTSQGYQSSNRSKRQQRAVELQDQDVHRNVTLLEYSEIWNPQNKDQYNLHFF